MVFPIQSAGSATAHTAPPLRVATAGEALFDLIEEPDGRLKPCAGGAVYNLTRALGLQGVGTQYLNPLSGDMLGRQLARGLHDAGVALAAPRPVRAPSALALAALDAGGKASYSFYRDGVADRQVTVAALNAACAALPELQVVATGCLALVAQDAAIYQPWLAAQRAAGRMVVVDANLRLSAVDDVEAYRANVMAALQHAHLIKVSDDDLEALAVPGTTALERAHYLQLRPCGASGIQCRRRHLAVGHAIAVEAVAGLALCVQRGQGQRTGRAHWRRRGQGHTRIVQTTRQLPPQHVARQRVEVQRAHALQAQRAGEVVDRAARAGFQAAIGLLDQVEQGLARRSHAQQRCGGCAGGGGRTGGLDRENHK